MPKSSNHLALARQWEMLKRIASRAPGITARELAEQLSDNGFPVTKRTVERDLVDLSSQFGIACNDDTKPYGWYWLPGRQYDFASVDLVDAVSLSLAGEVLKRMLPTEMLDTLRPKLEQAERKLDLLREHPMVRLTEKLRYVSNGPEFEPPSLRPGIMSSLQRALIEERQIEVKYAPFNAKAKELRLHPLSFVQRGTVPYLVATAFEYEDVRLYAIHRFEAIEVTTQNIRVPDDYSVDAVIREGLMEFGDGSDIVLKARISEQLASHLSETQLSPDQKIQYKNGGWLLTATVHNSWQLHFWILSQAAQIQVVSPKALKCNIHAQLKAACEQYDVD